MSSQIRYGGSGTGTFATLAEAEAGFSKNYAETLVNENYSNTSIMVTEFFVSYNETNEEWQELYEDWSSLVDSKIRPEGWQSVDELFAVGKRSTYKE